MLIAGSCHCRNISFTLLWRPEGRAIAARACSCSFCRKHGGVWTSCPAGSLAVTISDSARHTRYSFGTRTADFHVCAGCGIVPVVTSRIDGSLYAVVSVNALEGLDPALIEPAASVGFDGETEADRLLRRKQNWIADVAFGTGPA